MQLDGALERFVIQLEADGRSAHTVAQYRRHVRLLDRWLREERRITKINEIGHEVLALFLASPAARSRSDGKPKRATSVNALRSSIRTFFRYLDKAGIVDRNPARLIRRARCGSPPPRALSVDEQERLLTALAQANGPAAERDLVLFLLMLRTGIRLGSTLALDVEDVDLNRDELLLRRVKGNRVATVFLGTEIRDHLRQFIGERSAGPLFTSRGERRLGQRHARRRFAEMLERAKIRRRASPHSLRHSFGVGAPILRAGGSGAASGPIASGAWPR